MPPKIPGVRGSAPSSYERKENAVLTIKGPSDKPCFICASKERTVDVQFADKSFRGVLCMEHVYQKLKPEKEAKSAKP